MKSRGQLQILDAQETLGKIMVGGLPDEERFMQTLGGMMAKAGKGRPALRAFGEMVALLWADHNADAAIMLEKLWNKLGETYSFSLFCAYPIHGFDQASHGKLFARICKVSSR